VTSFCFSQTALPTADAMFSGTGGEPLDGQHQPLFGGSARPMPRETWEIGGATEA
jgi:hypothetical protein